MTAPGDTRGIGGMNDSVDEGAIEAFIEEYATDLAPVAVVMAAYREEGSIGDVVSAIPAMACGLTTSTIVVVDGSDDETAKIARKHGALVCDVPVNRGQGAALRLGYALARAGGASYIVTIDADGQYDPAEISNVLAPVVAGDADFVTGSRRLGQQETDDAIRHLGVRVFAWAISLLSGQRITDTSFGLRAMRAEVTGEVRLLQPQYQSAELLIGVIACGHRVREVPGSMLRRTAGESKKGHNLLYGFRYTLVVGGTWWRERRTRR